jgi:flagellar biosynthesis protein FlhF
LNSTMEISTAACKITAPSSREALRFLRESMGPDAIVLSNRVTATGVEILATMEEQVASMMTAVARPVAPAVEALSQAVIGNHDDSVLREIHSMREMMQKELTNLSWNKNKGCDPLRGQLLHSLLGAGFSAHLAKNILGQLPAGHDFASGLDYAKSELARQMPMLEDEAAMMDEGGVYALMGPTGVGKTTTTAKLAARCVMRFGAKKLALVTTDSFRIGAYEQLRIYGQILGVTVHAVKDAADLERALLDLGDKHMVLIDTVGMSQRDRAVSDQIAMLCGSSRPVKRLLLLNACSHGDTLNEVVHAYRRSEQTASSTDLAGCIFTKMDEATHPGALIDTAIRHQLPVHYISNGQKVPEHLNSVDRSALIDQVFQARSSSCLFVPGAADLDEKPAPSAPKKPRNTKTVASKPVVPKRVRRSRKSESAH